MSKLIIRNHIVVKENGEIRVTQDEINAAIASNNYDKVIKALA